MVRFCRDDVQPRVNLFTPSYCRANFLFCCHEFANRREAGEWISRLVNESDHWRVRAEEARTLARQLDDSESKDAMLRIAEDYERLARRADRASARLPKWTKH